MLDNYQPAPVRVLYRDGQPVDELVQPFPERPAPPLHPLRRKPGRPRKGEVVFRPAPVARLCQRCKAVPVRRKYCKTCAGAVKVDQTYRSMGRVRKTPEEISEIRRRAAEVRWQAQRSAASAGMPIAGPLDHPGRAGGVGGDHPHPETRHGAGNATDGECLGGTNG